MNKEWLGRRTTTMRRRNCLAIASPLAFMVAIALTPAIPALATDVRVLVYAQDDPADEVARLNGIDGIAASGTDDLDAVNPAHLANFDVFYAGSEFGHSLDSKASVLQDFGFSGGGIVVGQANVAGPIDWLPSGLGATVASISYPGSGYCVPTPAGLLHPIFQGLTTGDFGTSPSDTIYRSDLQPGWEVLLVHSRNSEMVVMAAGTHGEGRLLLWPDRYDTGVGDLPSDQFIQQAYAWVPEPAMLALLALGTPLLTRRRRGS